MRPIQFYQNKNDIDRKSLSASVSITKANQQMKWINYKENRNFRLAKTWALAEYYTKLFSHEARNVSFIWNEHWLVNLEWLFPTPEAIYIDIDTNFLILPLPLPTFQEFNKNYFQAPVFSYEPSLLTDISKYVYMIDYRKDNPYASKHKSIIYSAPHSTPTTSINQSTKEFNLKQSPDLSSRLRVYTYDWLSPTDEERLTDFNPTKVPDHFNSPYSSDTLCTLRHQNRNDEYLNYDIADIFQGYSFKDLDFMSRKYKTKQYKFTLLEITPYNEFVKQYCNSDTHPSHVSHAPESTWIRLAKYSKLLTSQSKCALPINPDYFWFDFYLHKSNWEKYAPSIYDYFLKHSYMNQFSALEIKSKLTMLEDAIKFKTDLYSNNLSEWYQQ